MGRDTKIYIVVIISIVIISMIGSMYNYENKTSVSGIQKVTEKSNKVTEKSNKVMFNVATEFPLHLIRDGSYGQRTSAFVIRDFRISYPKDHGNTFYPKISCEVECVVGDRVSISVPYKIKTADNYVVHTGTCFYTEILSSGEKQIINESDVGCPQLHPGEYIVLVNE